MTLKSAAFLAFIGTLLLTILVAADFIKNHMTKPVVAFIAGKTAPPGKRMGHAGAIVSGTAGSAQSKVEAFNSANVPVADLPSEVPGLLKQKLGL